MLRRLFSGIFGFKLGRPMDERLSFGSVGFHGDLYLLNLVDTVFRQCEYFVETGTNVGTTLAYVARTYPALRCFSCEPDTTAYRHATRNLSGSANVRIYNETSQRFVKRLLKEQDIARCDVLYWLDAHGYGFKWPLREEIATLTGNCAKAFVLIDDFLVPGLDCFGYDRYENQICSFEYIADSMDRKHQYRVYFPHYTERTSKHHPLRGWVLIEFGHFSPIDLPPKLVGKVRRVQ